MRDFRSAGLSGVEVALLSFAEKVATQADQIRQEAVDALLATVLPRGYLAVMAYLDRITDAAVAAAAIAVTTGLRFTHLVARSMRPTGRAKIGCPSRKQRRSAASAPTSRCSSGNRSTALCKSRTSSQSLCVGRRVRCIYCWPPACHFGQSAASLSA